MKQFRSATFVPFTTFAAVVATLLPAASAQERIYKWFGDQDYENFGAGLANAGDLNGDGIADLVVGAPAATAGDGLIRAFSGGDGSIVWNLPGNAGEALGSMVASLGDTDQDGVADFLTTNWNPPLGNPQGNGVTLYSGRTLAPIYTLLGGANEQFGWTIAALGDVDGDGVKDAAFTKFTPQQIEVVSGRTGASLYVLTAPSGANFFGESIASGGDVDLDGVEDLVVGDSFMSVGTGDPGAVWVYSGKSGAFLYQLTGLANLSYFGASVALVHDLNHDGRADVVVGAPNESISGTGTYGRARVYSGRNGRPLLDVGPQIQTNWNFSFGQWVADAGDMNRDGFGDFLVGQDYGGESESQNSILSQVVLFSGQDGGRIYHYFDPDCLSSAFGCQPRLVADLDGDGNAEVALANSSEDDSLSVDPGSASVWRGDDLFVDCVPRLAYWFTKTITLTVGQGVANAPFALYLVDVNGTPVNFLLATGAFDASGRASFSGHLPWGLGGSTFGFKAYALDASSKIIETGVETLTVW